MRLLFLNPNTNPALTELGARVARKVARPQTEIVPVTGQFGARYITTRATAAIAAHAALDAFARHEEAADVVLLACFGDPGLFALRELAPVPVVGMAEASCHLAATLGRKFSIVTGGHRWGPMLEEFVSAIGLASSLASVRTMAPSGAEIAANPEAALDALAATCRQAAHEDGADAMILGGLGLAGLADRIAGKVPVPVIDNVVAAVRAAETAASLGPVKATTGAFAAGAPIETTSLSARLAALIEGRGR
ncbi:MAG TPA: aspartate/glutamate racemase family protein [Hyphomicrobiaceae bacterium]|jgi:Asp/Glu/hydantoin racemase|nr:aspartate/glutamate racemase family protein [Hyphomicrobiaceae bacterium]